MAQNQIIPRRLWKIESIHRGVATHSLRTTVLSEFTINDRNSNHIDVINLSSSKNKNSNERTNCKENRLNVFESQFNYTADDRFKCCNAEALLPRLCLLQAQVSTHLSRNKKLKPEKFFQRSLESLVKQEQH